MDWWFSSAGFSFLFFLLIKGAILSVLVNWCCRGTPGPPSLFWSGHFSTSLPKFGCVTQAVRVLPHPAHPSLAPKFVATRLLLVSHFAPFSSTQAVCAFFLSTLMLSQVVLDSSGLPPVYVMYIRLRTLAGFLRLWYLLLRSSCNCLACSWAFVVVPSLSSHGGAEVKNKLFETAPFSRI